MGRPETNHTTRTRKKLHTHQQILNTKNQITLTNTATTHNGAPKKRERTRRTSTQNKSNTTKYKQEMRKSSETGGNLFSKNTTIVENQITRTQNIKKQNHKTKYATGKSLTHVSTNTN